MLLSVENLTFAWHSSRLFHHVNCRLDYGEIVWLRGENGSGKTTLLKLISGMIPHFSQGRYLAGDILLNGRSVLHNSPRAFFPFVGYIPSGSTDFLLMTGCLDEEMALIQAVLNIDEARIEERKETMVTCFDTLAQLWHVPYVEMSTDQKNLALVAIYVIQGARLFLMDETMKMIRPDDRAKWLEWMKNFKKQGGAIIMVSHEPFFSDCLIWEITHQTLYIA